MTSRIILYQGDSGTTLITTLVNRETNDPINVTGAVVLLRFMPADSSTVLNTLRGTALPGRLSGDGTIDTTWTIPGSAGRVAFAWPPGALNIPIGLYDGEIEITFPDGVVQTVPQMMQFRVRPSTKVAIDYPLPPGEGNTPPDAGGDVVYIGLFTEAYALNIPPGVNIVQSSGYSRTGIGAALYAFDPAVDADHVSLFPRESFMTANGRGFRLADTLRTVDKLGADPTGEEDSTDAFNAALRSQLPAVSGNDAFDLFLTVDVPPGRYKLGGDDKSVYVRKGQHLRGFGQATAQIDCAGTEYNTNPIIQMGTSPANPLNEFGHYGDGGGLGAEISGLFFISGPQGSGVIHNEYCAGWSVTGCWFSAAGIGVYAAGVDGMINHCTFDIGLTGLVLDGSTTTVSECLFFNNNYGIRVASSYDCTINDCLFDFSRYSAIYIGTGVDNNKIRPLNIHGCKFFMNEQFVEFVGYIVVACSDSDIWIDGCTFRNNPGYAFTHSLGSGTKVNINTCLFDGRVSNPAYNQSSTMGAVNASNMDVTMNSCTMRALFVSPILVGGTLSTTFRGSNLEFMDNFGDVTELNITAASGSVHLNNCIGDGRLMFNAQGNVNVFASGLTNWLNPPAAVGGRNRVLVPRQLANSFDMTVRANVLPGGNGLYRKTARYAVESQYGYSAGAPVTSLATATILASPATDFLPALDVQFEIDEVGGGTTAPGSTYGYIAVSWPTTYDYPELRVEPVL